MLQQFCYFAFQIRSVLSDLLASPLDLRWGVMHCTDITPCVELMVLSLHVERVEPPNSSHSVGVLLHLLVDHSILFHHINACSMILHVKHTKEMPFPLGVSHYYREQHLP